MVHIFTSKAEVRGNHDNRLLLNRFYIGQICNAYLLVSLFDHLKKKKQHYDLFIVFVFMFHYLSLRPPCCSIYSSRRWHSIPPVSVLVSCSLCCTSHCVTICCSKVWLSLQHSRSAALAFQYQTCQRQMVGIAPRHFPKCQGIQTLCI